ncbi:FAD-dependent oxidoreductase [Streptomyces sp. XY431]|uniref:FAD-dependent oxidoreductase n=1 Tax=Streptomyces sp. XY431 TaxID=1415562 RepID=UPI000AC6F201|nr:FAD-dependent oxidoreductase [Streptomyces sp. XY431]
MTADTDPGTREREDVTVVGGGLAGMTAAWTLRRLGLPVRLLEASPELGGMAGSRVIDGRTEDHGVHIFPAWYRNTLRLVGELGLADNLRTARKFHQLLPGTEFRTADTPAADRLLFLYGVLDLLAQDYRAGDESLHDFLRGRRYLSPAAIADIEHLFVASSAAESTAVSAAGFRGSIAAFVRHPGRVRMPRGDLQHWFIGPFRQRLEAAGVEVLTGRELTAVTTDDHRVRTLTLRGPAGADTDIEEAVTGQLVLAVPHGRLAALGPGITGALRPAHGILELTSRPLGALHLYLRRRLPGLPDEHIRLVGSPHAITLIDVGQTWPGHRDSLLNCVVGRVAALRHLADDEAVKILVEELMTYLPGLDWEDIEHICYQPHSSSPFHAPGPGSARHRPQAFTAFADLHLAGDFCAAPAGVAGMEAAVRSGLLAAESVRRRLRPELPPVRVETIGDVPAPVARLLRAALGPAVAAVRRRSGGNGSGGNGSVRR